MSHFLIEHAKRYNVSSCQHAPSGARYDLINGYWILQGSNEPMMESEYRIALSTKKYDRETGEDMKGE